MEIITIICLALALTLCILQLFRKEKKIQELQIELASLKAESTQCLKSAEEKLSLVEASKEKLLESFKALSLESLEKNSQAFLNLANTTFEKFQEKAEGSFKKNTFLSMNCLLL